MQHQLHFRKKREGGEHLKKDRSVPPEGTRSEDKNWPNIKTQQYPQGRAVFKKEPGSKTDLANQERTSGVTPEGNGISAGLDLTGEGPY